MSGLFRVNCLPSWDDPEASLWPYPSSVYVIVVHWGTSQLYRCYYTTNIMR